MATEKKRPPAKKPGAKSEVKKPSAKRASASAVRATARKVAAPKAPVSTPKTKPVRVSASKPEEKLAEAALMERAADTFEKSFKAAVPAAIAVNHKLVDIAQSNMKASIELARDLASAKSPLEIMRLGMSYWHDSMGALSAQALELRTLSSAAIASANEPIRAHLRGS